MFLKSLVISNNHKVIREILFRKGINLIVDETPSGVEKMTGNNVGKTTVLKLIDLAEVTIQKVCEKEKIDPKSIKIKNIGLRPGEKLYEELMSEDEADKALDIDDMYVIKPLYREYNEVIVQKIKKY